jgi:hypothetical protein
MEIVVKAELLYLIETKRLELCNIVKSYGFHSLESVKHSQELDDLLNKYQQILLSYNKAQ